MKVNTVGILRFVITYEDSCFWVKELVLHHGSSGTEN